MGLLQQTGEYPVATPPLYVAPPRTGGVLGERRDIAGDCSPDPLYQAANVPEDDFTYGSPLGWWDFYLRTPETIVHSSFPHHKLSRFMRRAKAYVSVDAALDAVDAVTELFESPEPARVLMYRAPFREWAESDGPSEFVWQLRLLYGAYHEDDVIRDDTATDQVGVEHAHGTKIWMASSAAAPFLLVERSEIVVGASGRREVDRVLEAVTVADHDQALEVASQLSEAERLHVEMVLSRLHVPSRVWDFVLAKANRRTVQCDADVHALAERYYAAPEQSRWRQAAERLGAIAASVRDWRQLRWVGERFSRNRAGQDSSSKAL